MDQRLDGSTLLGNLLHTRARTALKNRAFSFLLDWMIWGYVAYAVMFFLNHYWYTWIPGHWYDTLTLPSWGWPLTIIATLELTVICRNFGRSLGMRAFGLDLYPTSGERISFVRRLLRIAVWQLSVPVACVGFWSNPAVPLHDRAAGTVLRSTREVDREETDANDALGIARVRKPEKRALTTQWGIMSLFLLGLTFWLGWTIIEANLSVLTRRADKAGDLFQKIARPDFRYFFKEDPIFVLRRGSFAILDLMVLTLLMTLLSTVLGTAVAFPLSFLGARNIMSFHPVGLVIYTVVRGFFNIVRAIETLLWATIFAVWVGWGSPFAGVLALTVHTIAALGKLFSEQVEGIDKGPSEAIRAAGGNFFQVIRYAVIPQVVPAFWAFTLYRWDINVRMSTVIALVGAGGVGTLLFYYKNEGQWSIVGSVVVSIVVVVWLMDYLSGWLRERIVR
ncbi:phosphonate ABC transporter, permease protein PhnE [Candidatus Bipolaricaulota bacterium]|nr:phosphonate ABC transporter, permease protein PhnE [Candidatus Bipolaricaulota bacterium]TFH09765.1 MAG: phosphonate ABC transporter, permease protein PhnE [Candidatus Atribacteria bacterium]